MHKSITEISQSHTDSLDTYKCVNRLIEKSQQMKKVIGLVTDITDQTDLIASNTLLQANSSGNAGQESIGLLQGIQRLAGHSSAASKKSEN